MLAYNHYINFYPDSDNESHLEGTCLQIKENNLLNTNVMGEKLIYEMDFFNNQGRHLVLYTEREFARAQKGQLWSLEVEDVITYFWRSGDLTLNYIPEKLFTPQLLEYWTLHTILPIYFTIEEQYDFLHAGAIELEEPVLFVAESFGGKSTLTDFFLHQGHKVISDDKVATYEKDNINYVVPSYPYHRPYRNLEDLGYPVNQFCTQVKPLRIIYELQKGAPDCQITIKELIGVNKFIALRRASEINIPFLKRDRFLYLMRMASRTSVFQLTTPWQLERLSEVYNSIIRHYQQIVVRL